MAIREPACRAHSHLRLPVIPLQRARHLDPLPHTRWRERQLTTFLHAHRQTEYLFSRRFPCVSTIGLFASVSGATFSNSSMLPTPHAGLTMRFENHLGIQCEPLFLRRSSPPCIVLPRLELSPPALRPRSWGFLVRSIAAPLSSHVYKLVLRYPLVTAAPPCAPRLSSPCIPTSTRWRATRLSALSALPTSTTRLLVRSLPRPPMTSIPLPPSVRLALLPVPMTSQSPWSPPALVPRLLTIRSHPRLPALRRSSLRSSRTISASLSTSSTSLRTTVSYQSFARLAPVSLVVYVSLSL